MFQSLIGRAQRSVDVVLGKYLARLAVGGFFIVAVGFATAAAVIKLVEAWGPVTAYAVMAALFAFGGVVTWALMGSDAASESTAVATAAEPAPEEGARTDDDWAMVVDMMKLAAPVATPIVLRLIASKRTLLMMLGALAIFYLFSRARPAAEAVAAREVPAPPPA